MQRWIMQRAKWRKDGRLVVKISAWLEAEVYEQFLGAVPEERIRSFVITEAIRRLLADPALLEEVLEAVATRRAQPPKNEPATKKSGATKKGAATKSKRGSTAPKSATTKGPLSKKQAPEAKPSSIRRSPPPPKAPSIAPPPSSPKSRKSTSTPTVPPGSIPSTRRGPRSRR
ncbi:hypothetical protein [Polyangium sp. y55x31]|uniref:hypothetical protein n=1 Tax=Polyangium sp. y55x31 TaxID=3042688 RepID=UPI0024832D18|nr:hypothetical protein [Polyangium sp. y55x31]MDI1480404.1 hypothetical protein [Polyangium sp. y55x31]